MEYSICKNCLELQQEIVRVTLLTIQAAYTSINLSSKSFKKAREAVISAQTNAKQTETVLQKSVQLADFTEQYLLDQFSDPTSVKHPEDFCDDIKNFVFCSNVASLIADRSIERAADYIKKSQSFLEEAKEAESLLKSLYSQLITIFVDNGIEIPPTRKISNGHDSDCFGDSQI